MSKYDEKIINYILHYTTDGEEWLEFDKISLTDIIIELRKRIDNLSKLIEEKND